MPDISCQLRILATSDLHMHIEAFDYYTETPSESVGLARTAALIAQARDEVSNCLLFDNGDFLQGSPLGDFIARNEVPQHPMIAAMNHLRYDAVNLGNHEFSHGIPFLLRAVARANFPVICANVIRCKSGRDNGPFLPPFMILERRLIMNSGKMRVLRIGVIGALPPQTELWDHQAIGNQVRMTGIVDAIATRLPEMREAGADLIIVLAHCGIGNGIPDAKSENAALAVASLDGVDAVIMGHLHLPFPAQNGHDLPGVDPDLGHLHGKPAVMPGLYGSHLGVIDLNLRFEDGRWQVTNHHSAARPIALREADGTMRPLVQPDPEIRALVAPVHHRAIEWSREPIGKSDVTLHSYFSLVRDCPTLRLINRAQTHYITEKLANGPDAALPVLSASAPYRAGGRAGPENYYHLPPGHLRARHLANLYLYSNTIVALRLTGAEIKHWLERAALCFHRLTQGLADQPLLNPEIPAFQCDFMSGVTYEIDLAAPPDPDTRVKGNRILNLCHQGRPIAPDALFILATNSYRASGSGGYFSGDEFRIAYADRRANRDVLAQYVASHPLTEALVKAPAAWRFRKMPGTSAVFETAPAATAYLSEFPARTLTPLGKNGAGFEVMRLAL
jgi:2',3'-cyclic-nucleotide 2'-phosphodiesterase / 3'-nucleotidase